MKIGIIGKYPPIEGGVSTQNFWIARSLAKEGHEVHIITNAGEVEQGFRIALEPEDLQWMESSPGPGKVRVWQTEAVTHRYRHIPFATPYVTQLASLACQVIKSHDLEIIVAYYFEPYAVSGYLAAQWTGKPLIVRHAGSDMARLYHIPQLGGCYGEILKRAALVVSGEAAREEILSLGIEPPKIYPNPGFNLPEKVFNPAADAWDINAAIENLNRRLPPGKALRPVETGLPLIGIYGKIGEAKGSFDLLSALAVLKRKGLAFTLIALTHGWPEMENKFRKAVRENGLDEEIRILPFIPHWRIPSFLRSLTAACFLEHQFPVKFHSPRIPAEILACGICSVLSMEAAQKQIYAEQLIHGVNAYIVRNPGDHAELAAVLEQVVSDPERARSMGKRGSILAQYFPKHKECVGRYEQMLRYAQSLEAGSVKPEKSPDPFMQKYFSLTLNLLDESQQDTVYRRLTKNPAYMSEQAAFNKGLLFCELLSDLLEKNLPVPAFFTDILRWELYQINPADLYDHDTPAEMFFRIPPDLNRDELMMRIPVKPEHIQAKCFSVDMENLIPKIKESTPFKISMNTGSYHYLFSYFPNKPNPRIYSIDRQTFEFLGACGEAHTIKDLFIGGQEDQYLEMVQQLFNRGCLYFK